VRNYVDYIVIANVTSAEALKRSKEMLEFQTASLSQTQFQSHSAQQQHYRHSDRPTNQDLADLQRSSEHMSNHIKLLAKLDLTSATAIDSAALSEIVCECDGVLLVTDLTASDAHRAQLMSEVISGARHQAKPVSICCDIAAHPLSQTEVVAVAKIVELGADSICLSNDVQRLAHGAILRSVAAVLRERESTLERLFKHTLSMSLQSMSLELGHATESQDDEVDVEAEESPQSQSDSVYSDEALKIIEVDSVFNSMASSAVKTAKDLNCALIVVLTQSGRIARIVSKYRPHCSILAITDSEMIAKQAMLLSAIFPVLVLNMNGTDSLISRALEIAKKYHLIEHRVAPKYKDKVVVLAGTQSDILDEPCDFVMKLMYL